MTTRTLPCSRMIVALTGFMGCGKSSVGRELSVLLDMPLVDLDKYIVDKAGRSIADIFAEQGEKAFRDLESSALKELLIGAGSIPPENVLRTPPKQAWVPPSYVAEGGTVFRGGCLPFFGRKSGEQKLEHLAELALVWSHVLDGILSLVKLGGRHHLHG